MKKYLFVFLLLPLMWVGCSEPTPQPLGELQLTGTWEWTETTWASPADPLTPESEGYTLHLRLTEDNKWTYYHNCVVVARGTYKQKMWTDTILNQGELPYIDFVDHISNTSTTSFYELHKQSDYEHSMTTYPAPYLGGGRILVWKKMSEAEVNKLLK